MSAGRGPMVGTLMQHNDDVTLHHHQQMSKVTYITCTEETFTVIGLLTELLIGAPTGLLTG